ncbi:hypothetical protein N658DRAFT_496164 [Parathielavia hyrcaniae]|uniref:Uncharacterized protein n=1 Tax=Parathielavia hyrcaniae TaxID=113614 RepID=A0AAN6T1J9_9PEZI|nr:hypothetical protein N658DRAFT_496164 [Parathielavia hyrcaniae]
MRGPLTPPYLRLLLDRGLHHRASRDATYVPSRLAVLQPHQISHCSWTLGLGREVTCIDGLPRSQIGGPWATRLRFLIRPQPPRVPGSSPLAQPPPSLRHSQLGQFPVPLSGVGPLGPWPLSRTSVSRPTCRSLDAGSRVPSAFSPLSLLMVWWCQVTVLNKFDDIDPSRSWQAKLSIGTGCSLPRSS